MSRELMNITTGTWRGGAAEFRTDRMIVSVRTLQTAGATLDAIVADAAAYLGETPQLIHPAERPWAVLVFAPLANADTRIPALAEQLESRPDVLYAEPDLVGSAHGKPNDPQYGSQWWARRIGMEAAWNLTKGSGLVIIAVVDSGVSIKHAGGANHPDLDTARLITRHQISGVTVRHDYVGTNNIPDDIPRDEHGHGTLMTGIAAATPNNHEGVAGANWISPVYVARVLDQWKQQTSTSMIKLAVHDVLGYAAYLLQTTPERLRKTSGRRIVINLSLGFKRASVALEEMCRETDTGSVVLCVAAHPRTLFSQNGQQSMSTTDINYPAAYAGSFDHVIAVGASNQNEMVVEPLLSPVHGPVTIFAPGTSIRSTVPNYRCTMFNTPTGQVPPYDSTAGTSAACAIVSGVVSLVWSRNHNLAPRVVKQLLIDTADWFSGNRGSFPRISARGAVNGA